jgi:hypothetical protein
MTAVSEAGGLKAAVKTALHVALVRISDCQSNLIRVTLNLTIARQSLRRHYDSLSARLWSSPVLRIKMRYRQRVKCSVAVIPDDDHLARHGGRDAHRHRGRGGPVGLIGGLFGR